MARDTAAATKALAKQDRVRDPKIEKILHDLGVKYDLVRDVPTAHFDHATSLANQARFSPLDPAVVAQYRRDLRAGDIFPAVTATVETRSSGTSTYTIVDGNHRLRAHSEEGLAVAAYVLAEDTEPDLVVQLTYMLNKTHGKNLDKIEKLAHAAQLVEMNISHADACQRIGVEKVSQLTNYIQIQKAGRQRQRAKVPDSVWNRIKSDQTKLRIGNVSTNTGLRLLAELVADAQLSTAVVSKLVTQINDHRGTDEQRDFILDLRDTYLPGGKAPTMQQGTGRGMGARQQLGLMLGTALKFADDIEGTASLYKGPERASQAQKVRDAAKALSELADRLEAPVEAATA